MLFMSVDEIFVLKLTCKLLLAAIRAEKCAMCLKNMDSVILPKRRLNDLHIQKSEESQSQSNFCTFSEIVE